ncbi:glycosyltransferase family 2 protein [Oscillospiraceae bacterium OttesenSCG-928-G22]|nr:glycosyltransferase family 2 protein [Oscillospiraceae bacterium OttesenSCG-928-G22]
MLSVIIPVYNEADALTENLAAIRASFDRQRLSYTLHVVDDGSSDGTWDLLLSISKTEPRVRGVRLSRNFGKEAAISAGLRAAAGGSLFLVMDSDLQHPPDAVSDMLRLMEETGADIVNGVKRHRGDESAGRRASAGGFYRLFRWASGVDLNRSSDFKLLSARVVDSLSQFQEGRLFFRGLVSYVGFKTVEYEFEVRPRHAGNSRFSTRKLVRMAIDTALSYTAKPIYFTLIVGAVFFVLAVVLGIQTLVNFFTGRAVSGFTTVILLLLILGSALTLSLGVIGAYIARIYDEVKGRPPYIISDRTDGENTSEGAND